MIVIRLLGFLLVAEGVTTLFWFVRLLPTLGWRDRSSVALILVRGLVGALQLSSGWGLTSGRPSARPLARFALLASAGLMTLEIGARMVPTDLDPTYRWPLVWAYWVYALGAIWALRLAPVSTGSAAPPVTAPPKDPMSGPVPPASEAQLAIDVHQPPPAEPPSLQVLEVDDRVRPGDDAGE